MEKVWAGPRGSPRPRRDGDDRLSLAVQARLAGLAQRHRTAVIFLTEKAEDVPSLGPLIALRVQTARAGALQVEGQAIRAEVIKDKRLGARWRYEERLRAPPGLR
jgi:hypothetical protein